MSGGVGAWDSYRIFCVTAVSSAHLESSTHASAAEKDEVQDRLGLVEEYLSGWDALQSRRVRVAAQVCHRERQRLLVDEAEERRFMEEDVAWLPYRLFAELLWGDARRRLIDAEAETRKAIVGDYRESFLRNLFLHYEALQRMQVTYEALDSLAVKACHVGRPGLREGQLGRSSVPVSINAPTTVGLSPLRACFSTLLDSAEMISLLIGQEKEERVHIDAARQSFMADAAVAWVRYEKHLALPCCTSTVCAS
jgi:hypothetical protein